MTCNGHPKPIAFGDALFGEWRCNAANCTLDCNSNGDHWAGMGFSVCECFRRHGNVKIFRGHCDWNVIETASCEQNHGW